MCLMQKKKGIKLIIANVEASVAILLLCILERSYREVTVHKKNIRVDLNSVFFVCFRMTIYCTTTWTTAMTTWIVVLW